MAKSPEIPEEYALQGFDGVRAYATDPDRSTGLLEDTLGFRSQGDYTWEARGERRGGWYAYDTAPEGRGIPGAGTVHHVAWATTIEDHDAWQQRVAEAGHRPTPVIDRFYFKSIYFREPNGILFELATLGPGFATDEDAGAPRRAALAAARLRAPPRADRAAADAAAQPARMTIEALERPAEGEPAGTLVLLHGRGADEHDLYPLLDALDPERRLRGLTPRGPLALPPGGRHWYRLGGIPTPEAETFWPSFEALSGLPRRARRPARARRLLSGSGDELRAQSRSIARAAAVGAAAAVGIHAVRGRARPRSHRPRRVPGGDRPRHARPGHPGRLQPRRPRRSRGRGGERRLHRVACRPHDRPTGSSRRCAASLPPRSGPRSSPDASTPRVTPRGRWCGRSSRRSIVQWRIQRSRGCRRSRPGNAT